MKNSPGALKANLQVLVITSRYPTGKRPQAGIFVERQVRMLREAGVLVDLLTLRDMGLGPWICRQPVRYLAAILEMHARLTTRKIDLIHAHYGPTGLIALTQTTRPVVVTFRGSDLQGLVDDQGRSTIVGRVLRRVSRIVADHADEVIVVSSHMGVHLQRSDYHILPSGLDLDLFRSSPREVARHKLGLPLRSKLVLFVGDPKRPEKRYKLATGAVGKLHRRMDVRLVVANGVEHCKIPLYMSACDALVLTSTHEGSPNVVKEALACNLPVVSVDVGDVSERLRNVEGCFLCGDDSIDTIASGIQRALATGRLRYGRDSVRDLDERLLIPRLVSVYHAALDKRG